MKIVKSITEMQKISEEFRIIGKKIAVVPTMGFLHKGHISLIKKASELADIVIMTLFVNPTQFSADEDFSAYPRDFDRDSKMAEDAGCSILFNPELEEMYPDEFNSEIKISGITNNFEGKSRPSHFNGVATVVAKLLNATLPHYAIFGQKDFQQSLLIKQLVLDLNINTKIVVAPIVRETDGLAMSSRNKYLSEDLRNKASIVFKALEEARMSIEQGERDRKTINAIMHKTLRSVKEIKIDYACSANALNLKENDRFNAGQLIVLLIAVYLGRTRLIDNAIVTLPAVFPPLK